jgi:hypothetical protein
MRKTFCLYFASPATIATLATFFLNAPTVFAQNNEEQNQNMNLESNPPPPHGTDKSMRRIAGVPLPNQNVQNQNTQSQNSHNQNSQNQKLLYPNTVSQTNDSKTAFEQGANTPIPQIQKFPSIESLTVLAPMRKITLNGVNISSLRNEELKGVRVKIDAEGNIDLIAPHYEVSSQSSFHPLFPSEMPKFQKEKVPTSALPQGTFSKDGTLVAP